MAKKQEVKKHSSAIHSSGTMSLLERKLSNVLLYNAYDELLTEQVHSVNLAVLCEVVGYNSNDTTTLKKSFKNLKNISIDWDILGEDGESDWGSFSLLSGARIKGGMCYYEYPAMLAEKLAEPEIYGNINLQMQRQFASGYALTVYEMCSQYKGLLRKRNFAYTKWFTLEQFKLLLGVENLEYYDDFRRLNNKIIKPAIHEINGTLKKYAGTDIFIEPEYKKVNRSITDIRFKIKLNPQTALPIEKDENEEIRKTALYLRLIEYDIKDKGAIHMLQANSEEYILEKLDLVDKAEEQGKITRSVSGYLTQAIEQDYKAPKSKSDSKAKADLKNAEAKQLKLAEENRAEEISKLTQQYSQEIREEFIATLSKPEQVDLLAKLKEDKPTVILKSITDLSSFAIAHDLNKSIPDFDKKLDDKLKTFE